jgi:uracil-DNA glycosylase
MSLAAEELREEMATLKQRLKDYLGRDWRHDLDPVWRTFFENLDPLKLDDVSEGEAPKEVYPARLKLGAEPRGAGYKGPPKHMTRAFDGIEPKSVRVVVLGQDPYPNRERATGRAFEDGTWAGDFTKLADSLQPIVRSALALAWNEPSLHGAEWDWNAVCARLQDDQAREAMSAFFDKLAGQGVLFVNAAWTRTRGSDEAVHRDLWRPVIDYLLRELAQEERPVVLMLLGDRAACRFCDADPVCRQTAIVRSAHSSSKPNAREQYPKRPNPLERVNDALRAMGDNSEIVWWPPNPSAPA